MDNVDINQIHVLVDTYLDKGVVPFTILEHEIANLKMYDGKTDTFIQILNEIQKYLSQYNDDIAVYMAIRSEYLRMNGGQATGIRVYIVERKSRMASQMLYANNPSTRCVLAKTIN